MKKYFVFSEAKSGDTPWDSFSGVFGGQEEAEAAAYAEWDHLTDAEKRKREITVAYADVPDGEDPLEFALTNGYFSCLELR